MNFCRAKGAKAAKSRSDAMTIAQPFMAGSSVNQMEKSREGRQNGSFVPVGTLENCGPRVPAMNGWAILNGARKLKAPVTADRKFEDVVKSAQAAAVLVLVY